jgi:hypothetical protein
MCSHLPQCPSADASDRLAARTIACHPEQGWSLLCNGVVLFEDGGALGPDTNSPDHWPLHVAPLAAA